MTTETNAVETNTQTPITPAQFANAMTQLSNMTEEQSESFKQDLLEHIGLDTAETTVH